MDMTNYVKAGFPLIFIETLEIKRGKQGIHSEYPVLKWDAITGIDNNSDYKDIFVAFEYCTTIEKSIVIMENLDWFFEKKEVQQLILNTYQIFKNKQVCIVGIGTNSQLPDALKKIFHIIDFSLPSISDFQKITKDLSEYDITIEQGIENSCVGLGYEETENSLALQAIEQKEITRQGVIEARKNLIKKSGFMEIIKPEKIENVGGMDQAKEYFSKRLKAWEKGNEHLPKIKSVLLVGIPGSGKSLIAKSLSSLMNVDLIQANVGAMKGSLVGETEKNTRLFTKTIDTIGTCVILLDEIEKMFSSGEGDSGASKGQLGHILSWFNDRTSDCVIIATSNKLSSLPPEFLRAGRWDIIFFVGFPNLEERKQIIEIMNKKHGSNLPLSLASKLENFTGAEIEQLAKDSHFDDIDFIIQNMPTMAKTRKDDIKAIQEQSKQYRQASSIIKACQDRKISI